MKQKAPGRYLIFGILIITLHTSVFGKRKVTFLAEDGLTITADLYYKGNQFPYVLLFHQDGSSRGEYNEIAEKIMNLNYNCLAVDLRSGNKINFTDNETAMLAKQKSFPDNYPDAEKDIIAAIDYAFQKSDTSVILFGSSYSASLCLKIALTNPRVSAVVTFGLGEYLKPDFVLGDNLGSFYKPLFVGTNKSEYPFVQKMFKTPLKDNISIFLPSDGKGEHGAKALWKPSANSNEYWLALLMFFSKL